MRPLDGCLVLDFTTLLPGPFATLLLAEAGAEVVKIERPGRGDELRGDHPQWGRDGVHFALLNRGKKSVAVDLKNAAGRRKLDRLVARADVIVEQFRPGVMARLGLDYDTVSKAHPRIIYCSITGYGQTGAKRDEAGHDLNYIGDTGLLALSMGQASGEVVPPALIADIAGGSYPAVMNILLALRERESTGRGRYLDVSMTDNMFPLMYWALGSGWHTGQWPGNGTERLTGGSPRYHLYATSDGRTVAVAPLEQRFWEVFCDIIELEPEFRDDRKNPAATIARVAAILAREPASTWAKRFAGRDCCCSIVADIQHALQDPHYAERGILNHRLTGEDGRTIPALPVPIDPAFRGSPETPAAAPSLGAHTEEELGS